MKLLLIEDDLMLSNGLNKALKHEGFVVNCAENGTQGIELAFGLEPDLVILDLGLPDMDGLKVLGQLRSSTPSLPILILTARDSVPEKIRALDGGADDYLAKPFDMEELLARIRVIARRLGTASSSEIEIRSVKFDVAGHVARVDDVALALTRRELMILKTLMQNAGRIQTKQMIEDRLYNWGEEIASNTIEVHISNLRKKLPNDFIETVRGVGYTIGLNPKVVN